MGGGQQRAKTEEIDKPTANDKVMRRENQEMNGYNQLRSTWIHRNGCTTTPIDGSHRSSPSAINREIPNAAVMNTACLARAISPA